MKKIVLILGILLANNLFADIQEYIAKCLGGSVGACDSVVVTFIGELSEFYFNNYGISQGWLKSKEVSCNNYMKVLKKGCNLGSGLCCAVLGDEYNSISVCNGNNCKWKSKYGETAH